MFLMLCSYNASTFFVLVIPAVCAQLSFHVQDTVQDLVSIVNALVHNSTVIVYE
jgi:hypothetical protein